MVVNLLQFWRSSTCRLWDLVGLKESWPTNSITPCSLSTYFLLFRMFLSLSFWWISSHPSGHRTNLLCYRKIRMVSSCLIAHGTLLRASHFTILWFIYFLGPLLSLRHVHDDTLFVLFVFRESPQHLESILIINNILLNRIKERD